MIPAYILPKTKFHYKQTADFGNVGEVLLNDYLEIQLPAGTNASINGTTYVLVTDFVDDLDVLRPKPLDICLPAGTKVNNGIVFTLEADLEISLPKQFQFKLKAGTKLQQNLLQIEFKTDCEATFEGYHMTSRGQIIAGGIDGDIVVYDASSCTVNTIFKGWNKSMRCICVSPDKKLLAASTTTSCRPDEYSIRLYDQSYKALDKFADNEQTFCMAFSSDSKLLASGNWQNQLKLWDVTDPLNVQFVSEMTEHTNWIVSVCISPDDRYILSGSLDSTAKIWNRSDNGRSAIAFGDTILTLKHNSPVKCVRYAPDNRFFVTSTTRCIIIWQGSAKVSRIDAGASSICINSDGTKLISKNQDIVSIWDINSDYTCTMLHSVQVEYISSTIAISPDDTEVVCWPQIIDIKSGEIIRALPQVHSSCNSICWQ